MSTTVYYARVVPDLSEMEVYTEASPGYVVDVMEDNGAAGFQMRRTDKMNSSNPKDFITIMMNPDDAEAFITALREATAAARLKPGSGWAAPVIMPADGK